MEAHATTPPPTEPGPRRPIPKVRTATRRLVADRVARWVVTAGGLAIVASILGILLFVVVEVWPLFRGAAVESGDRVTLAGVPVGAVATDEYKSHAAVLAEDGRLLVVRLADGARVVERTLSGPASEKFPVALERTTVAPGQPLLTGSTPDGRIVAVPVAWDVSFVGRERRVAPAIGEPVWFSVDDSARRLGAWAARVSDDGSATAAVQLDDGTLVVLRRSVARNLFTEEITESWRRSESSPGVRMVALVLDRSQRSLYGAAEDGSLLRFTIADGEIADTLLFHADGAPVTALSLLIGDRSLIVGRGDGSLSQWFAVRQPDESFRLERIREFPPLGDAVTLLSPSMRDKGFLALDRSGGAGLYYATSNRLLWTGRMDVVPPEALYYTPKADGAVVGGDGVLRLLDIRNPHPEVGLTALFGNVWYEGYTEPDLVWQSSGASDDFEPKLSLTPLMVGTLKGTLYSLILAIPLGVLGAMYTSQFMHADLKRFVKPTVEIMAALPSVVLGFLAGLWLAPRVERVFPALMVMLVVLPVLVLAAGSAWRALPERIRGRLPGGSEAILYAAVVAAGIVISLGLNGALERTLFGGSFPGWLLQTTGLQYDQRNAVVVGLAMGFAVIPIIFSIAEDAFSNVPRNLVAGSLALGANRWQTVTRVVLPTASPGIFSAIMIGFGRAVGETMIVLMATGNTPVMDWSPFNGFRTLSANIAVEIPEAPHGGTLYRTLFLAALILFVMTFVINTVAELVRQRLRRRYSDL